MARTVAGTVRNGEPALFRFPASWTENLPCPPLYLPDRCYPDPPTQPRLWLHAWTGLFCFSRMFSSLRRPFLFFQKFSRQRRPFLSWGVFGEVTPAGGCLLAYPPGPPSTAPAGRHGKGNGKNPAGRKKLKKVRCLQTKGSSCPPIAVFLVRIIRIVRNSHKIRQRSYIKGIAI